jgi:hypothetical protein
MTILYNVHFTYQVVSFLTRTPFWYRTELNQTCPVNRKVRFCVYESLPLGHILSQMNPVHNPTAYFLVVTEYYPPMYAWISEVVSSLYDFLIQFCSRASCNTDRITMIFNYYNNQKRSQFCSIQYTLNMTLRPLPLSLSTFAQNAILRGRYCPPHSLR